jgi:bifunctional non-homologous end joining protein LigD
MTEKKIVINKVHLTFTSLDKLLFPEDGITKGEVIEYYLAVGSLFLKHIKDRPLTLQRYPKGIQFPGFIQKHENFIPDWIKMR